MGKKQNQEKLGSQKELKEKRISNPERKNTRAAGRDVLDTRGVRNLLPGCAEPVQGASCQGEEPRPYLVALECGKTLQMMKTVISNRVTWVK